MRKIMLKVFVIAFSFSFAFSSVIPANAATFTEMNSSLESIPEANIHTSGFSIEEEETIKILDAIENMPREIVYSSQEAKQEWIEEYTGVDLGQQPASSNDFITANASFGDYATCAGALGTAALVNLTPAKLLKVKSALKAAGGATTFVKKFSSSYKVFRHKENKPFTTAVGDAVDRAAIEAGPEAKEALADLFAISTVIGGCSGVFE